MKLTREQIKDAAKCDNDPDHSCEDCGMGGGEGCSYSVIAETALYWMARAEELSGDSASWQKKEAQARQDRGLAIAAQSRATEEAERLRKDRNIYRTAVNNREDHPGVYVKSVNGGETVVPSARQHANVVADLEAIKEAWKINTLHDSKAFEAITTRVEVGERLAATRYTRALAAEDAQAEEVARLDGRVDALEAMPPGSKRSADPRLWCDDCANKSQLLCRDCAIITRPTGPPINYKRGE